MARRSSKISQRTTTTTAYSSANIPAQTIVIDNGAYTIKAGFANSNPTDDDCTLIPNCIGRNRDRRLYIGAQVDACRDYGEMAFRRPVEKGFIVNWEGEKVIWDRSFLSNEAVMKFDPHETNLVLSEAPNCPQQLQTNCDQMVFEEYEFASYARCLGTSLNAYNDISTLFNDPPPPTTSTPCPAHIPAEGLLVIDSGYSHTTVTPLLSGRPVQTAIRRATIGGKFLTNRLKDLISLRHYDVRDEPHLVNQIKEDACYVSQSFAADIEAVWLGRARDPHPPTQPSPIRVDYVLPDYDTINRGFVRPHDVAAAAGAAREKARGMVPREDVLPLGNERFTVPELLFTPTDVGLREEGIPGTVMQSLRLLPEGLWPAMLANVVVVGGNVGFAGFMERLERDLRRLVPSEYALRIATPSDPVKYSWLGGARLASHRDTLRQYVVTREDYLEHGPNWLVRRFANGPVELAS